MVYNRKILNIDDDDDVSLVIEMLLARDGYIYLRACDGKSGIEKAKKERPDLIILDIDLPDIDGFNVCKTLKADPVTRFIPVIITTGTRKQIPDKLTGLKIGADVYLHKPFNHEELLVEVERLLRRTSEQLSASPLTKLPGNLSIEQEINSRINSGNKFAVCYVDIDNFKPFNDYYGFARGDEVIKFLANVITESIAELEDGSDFIGHIGGDDFIIITKPERIDEICMKIVSKFDTNILKYYNDEDINKGYIETLDRQNNLHRFSIMTLSISVASNEKRVIEHYGKLIDILVELKKYAKSKKERNCSLYVKDRRKDKIE